MTQSVICDAIGARITSGDTAAGATRAGGPAERDDMRNRGARLGCPAGPTACGRAGDPARGETSAGGLPATRTRHSRRPLTTPGALAALLGSRARRGLPTEVSAAAGRPTAVGGSSPRTNAWMHTLLQRGRGQHHDSPGESRRPRRRRRRPHRATVRPVGIERAHPRGTRPAKLCLPLPARQPIPDRA